jgi:hypothetical protein
MVRSAAFLPRASASLRTLAVTAFALLLAGCIGGGGLPSKGKSARAKPQTTGLPAFQSADAQQCLVDLRAAKVKFTPLANQNFGGGCSAIDAVKLIDVGTPVTGLGPTTCPLARNFAAWVQFAVRPAARVHFKSEVVKVETFGTYSCRNIYGGRSGRLSQHAYANAIDVSGFVLADGRRIMLDGGWQGDAASKAFLRALHASACRRFGTVLGPDYNAAHYNHFHFDMSGEGYCR